MKKNKLYILLGLVAVGGAAWYYMKKKKKGTVIVSEPEKITEAQYAEAVQTNVQQPEPMQALFNVVKKISQPSAAKKAEKEKVKAAKALVNTFGTPTKKKVKKVKTKKLGEIAVLI
jgi:LPXTG-motif cell wall-anchored protein